jgi:hypothetical protein
MPKKEWTKAQSVGHATTRIIFVNADLVREMVPNADAKTIIGSKLTVSPDHTHLLLQLKKFDKWPPNE